MHAAVPVPAKPVAQWVFEPQRQAQQPAAPQYQPAAPQYQPAAPQYQPAAPQYQPVGAKEAVPHRVATPIVQPEMAPADRLPQDSPLRPAPPPDNQWVYAPAQAGGLPPPQPIPVEEPSVPDIPMRLVKRSAIPGLAPYDEHGIPMPIQPAVQPGKKKKRGKAFLLVGCLLVLVVLTAGAALALAIAGGYVTVPGISKDRIAQFVPSGGIDSIKEMLSDRLDVVALGEKAGGEPSPAHAQETPPAEQPAPPTHEEASPPPAEEAPPPPAEEAAQPPVEEAAPPPAEEEPATAEEAPAAEEEEAGPSETTRPKKKKHGKKKPKVAAVSPKPAPAEKYPTNLGGNLPDKPATEDVKAALKAVEPSVKACGKGMSGPATVSVKVSGSTGKATDVKVVSGPFKGTPQGTCIEKAVKKAKFPRFKQSSISFSYPFAVK